MSETPPPGHTRAGASRPGTHGDVMRSDNYPVSETSDDLTPELVISPGHGAVGVFQAPRPVQPRPNGASAPDSSVDIDSPFLDLFGGAPAPAQVKPGPASPEVADDYDYGFDFDDRPTEESAAAVTQPNLDITDRKSVV